MKRRALLIDAGRASMDDIIDGCRADVLQMKEWLGGNAGGAWDEAEEICWLHNESLETIEKGVRWVEQADFAFVAFSGHGQINDVNGKRSQVVYVGKGTCEEIDFGRLKPKTGKSIVICDACREVHVKSPILMSMTENMRRYVKASVAKKYTRVDYKREYLRLVDQAGGRYTMYSCSAGQRSGDDEDNGGRFTSTLLGCAATWYASADPKTHFTIGNVFGEAVPIVSASSRKHNQRYPQDAEAFQTVRGLSSKYPFVIHYE